MKEYELRVQALGKFASAQIIEITKGIVPTAIAAITTPSAEPTAILRFQSSKPIQFSPLHGKKSRLGKLKPSRLRVNLWLVEAEWDLAG
jgi:hypothetical protein